VSSWLALKRRRLTALPTMPTYLFDCDAMAVLNIRNLPRKVHNRLRIRAAKANRSMEAEARAILTRGVHEIQQSIPASALQEWVDHLSLANF